VTYKAHQPTQVETPDRQETNTDEACNNTRQEVQQEHKEDKHQSPLPQDDDLPIASRTRSNRTQDIIALAAYDFDYHHDLEYKAQDAMHDPISFMSSMTCNTMYYDQAI